MGSRGDLPVPSGHWPRNEDNVGTGKRRTEKFVRFPIPSGVANATWEFGLKFFATDFTLLTARNQPVSVRDERTGFPFYHHVKFRSGGELARASIWAVERNLKNSVCVSPKSIIMRFLPL